MEYNPKRIRIILAIVGLLAIGLIVYAIIHSATTSGKVQVTINTLPGDASITVNGASSGHTAYLVPGKYSFKATKDGFSDGSVDLYISNDVDTVYIPLTPVTAAAKSWASAESVRNQYEEYGGMARQYEGMAMNEQNPIIEYLPYADVSGPFSIDYGFTDPNDRFKFFILISNATPEGRQKALEWIRAQGVDPSTLDIRYKDYTRTLEGDESNVED
jgi:hypothetical protein